MAPAPVAANAPWPPPVPTRRRLLALSALAALAALGPLAGPAAASDCLRPLAPELAGHDLVLSAFAGLN